MGKKETKAQRQARLLTNQKKRHKYADSKYESNDLKRNADKYLHYYAYHAEGMEVLNFNKTKNDLLKEQLNTFRKLKSRVDKRSVAMSGEDLDSLLGLYATERDEKVIAEEINRARSATLASKGFNTKYESTEEAVTALLNRLDNAEAVMNEFCNANEVIKEWSDLLGSSEVYDTVVREIVEEKRLTGSKALASQQGYDKILEMVLSKWGDGEVKKIKEATKVPTAFIHLKMLVQSLAEVDASSSTGHTVKHSDSTRRDVTSEEDLIGEAATKMGKYLDALCNDGLEAVTALGYLTLHADVLEELNGIKTKIKQTGTKKYAYGSAFKIDTTTYFGNEEGEDITEWSKKQLENYVNKTVSKPDVVLEMTKNGVRVRAGVSVKNTLFSKEQSSVNVKTQDETPMLTLLTRQCKFSSVQMEKVYQLLSGIDEDGSSGFDKKWDEVKNYARYACVLRTIIGYASNVPINYYIVLNRQFYSVADILSNLLLETSDVQLKGEVDPEYLERSWYTKQNVKNWEPPTKGNPGKWDRKAATLRSYKTRGDTRAGLQAAKVRITIKLSQLGELYKQGRGSILASPET